MTSLKTIKLIKLIKQSEQDISKVYHFSREPSRMHVLFTDKNQCFVDKDTGILHIYPQAFINSDWEFTIEPNQSVFAAICNKSTLCHHINHHQCDLIHSNIPNLIYGIRFTNNDPTTPFFVKFKYPLCKLINQVSISYEICMLNKESLVFQPIDRIG